VDFLPDSKIEISALGWWIYFPPEAFFGLAEAGLLRAAITAKMAGNETVRSAQVSVLQETFYA